MNARALLAGSFLASGALLVLRSPALAAVVPAAVRDAVNDYTPAVIGDALDLVGPVFEDFSGTAPAPVEYVEMNAENNVHAFLQMIRYAEGTDGASGYMTLFGGGLFYDYTDHPRQRIPFGNTYSSAAGAYQFLAGTWDDAARALGLADFSPDNQDLAAIWLIRRRGALDDVRAGRFADAVRKCAKEWASLPGSPYGQPVRTLDQVAGVYQQAGGVLAA